MSDLILYKEDIDKLNKVLSNLVSASKAQCAFMVNRDGHLMTRMGDTQSIDTNTLAALVAGSFASTKAIANILGEPEFSVMFHQGEQENIHLSLVEEEVIMIIVFNDQTSIGMIRLYAQQHGKLLGEILNAAVAKQRALEAEAEAEQAQMKQQTGQAQNQAQAQTPPAQAESSDLGLGVEEKLDDLFGGAS